MTEQKIIKRILGNRLAGFTIIETVIGLVVCLMIFHLISYQLGFIHKINNNGLRQDSLDWHLAGQQINDFINHRLYTKKSNAIHNSGVSFVDPNSVSEKKKHHILKVLNSRTIVITTGSGGYLPLVRMDGGAEIKYNLATSYVRMSYLYYHDGNKPVRYVRYFYLANDEVKKENETINISQNQQHSFSENQGNDFVKRSLMPQLYTNMSEPLSSAIPIASNDVSTDGQTIPN